MKLDFRKWSMNRWVDEYISCIWENRYRFRKCVQKQLYEKDRYNEDGYGIA